MGRPVRKKEDERERENKRSKHRFTLSTKTTTEVKKNLFQRCLNPISFSVSPSLQYKHAKLTISIKQAVIKKNYSRRIQTSTAEYHTIKHPHARWVIMYRCTYDCDSLLELNAHT